MRITYKIWLSKLVGSDLVLILFCFFITFHENLKGKKTIRFIEKKVNSNFFISINIHTIKYSKLIKSINIHTLKYSKLIKCAFVDIKLVIFLLAQFEWTLDNHSHASILNWLSCLCFTSQSYPTYLFV